MDELVTVAGAALSAAIMMLPLETIAGVSNNRSSILSLVAAAADAPMAREVAVAVADGDEEGREMNAVGCFATMIELWPSQQSLHKLLRLLLSTLLLCLHPSVSRFCQSSFFCEDEEHRMEVRNRSVFVKCFCGWAKRLCVFVCPKAYCVLWA
jgi:hypothetical protein